MPVRSPDGLVLTRSGTRVPSRHRPAGRLQAIVWLCTRAARGDHAVVTRQKGIEALGQTKDLGRSPPLPGASARDQVGLPLPTENLRHREVPGDRRNPPAQRQFMEHGQGTATCVFLWQPEPVARRAGTRGRLRRGWPASNWPARRALSS
jgi:hypothetical protein